MIFLILLQIQVDSLYSKEKSFLFRGIQPPKDVIEIYDSTFYTVLNSMDTSKKNDEWLRLFFHKFEHEIGKNKKLIDYAEQFYIEKGQWLAYYLPRIPLSDIHKSIEILREWKRKHNRYLYTQRLSKLKDSLLKKKLEEYYKFKDGLSTWYEKIPEEMAVDEDFIYISTPFYMGGFQWFNKVGEKWFTNTLKTLNPGDSLFVALNPKDSLFIGYFSLLQSRTDTTASLFLLSRDSLKQIPSDSFYHIYHYSLEEDTWIVGFYYNREKNLWRADPIFLPLYFDKNSAPYLNYAIYNINKNSKLFSFLSKSLSKIEEISVINSDCRIGGADYSVWWITDRFSGHSYEKIKVRVFFIENIILPELEEGLILSDIISCPEKKFLSKAIDLQNKKTKKNNIEGSVDEDRVLDSITVYYRLPWVDKPEIKAVDGLGFLVNPTRNPIYRTIHTILVTGSTLRNIGLKIVEYFRHIFLTWPFFSSYIWTFVVIAAICFLIGFGIFKIKVFISRS